MLFLALSTLVHAQTVKHNIKSSKRVVVIDAGHGGKDPGTHGKSAIEKDIALEIALKLGERIQQSYNNVEVVYTREDDTFVELFKRIRVANEVNADLFISIHCNNVKNPEIRGTETYVMGLHRAEENLEVASRENQSILMESDYADNYDGYDPSSPVGHIMLSMYQDAYLKNSIELASAIEENLSKKGLMVSRGVKQAGFAVLRRASMPSVLVETGFLSNPEEEKYLSSKEGQEKIVFSIGEAVGSFLGEKSHYQPTTKPVIDEAIVVVETEEKPVPKRNYTIQIAAMKTYVEDLGRKDLEPFGQITIHEVDGLYKYRIGAFSKKSDAKSNLENLKRLGFTGAFITTY